jgi:hypothetical protein
MGKVYIQFSIPDNKAKAENWLKSAAKRMAVTLLSSIVPKANPDFDNKIDAVKYWMVECDTTTGIPQREIGLDEENNVILKMPFRNNYGYWTDNHLLLEDFNKHFDACAISSDLFEKKWTLLEDE